MTHSRPELPSDDEIQKLPKDGGPNWNRLIFENSPYLLQHASNPVDWRPWGDEAFQTAREEDKPLFLSIGYATCHWCHVMEHESFEDVGVAALMNEYFVCIKVDKEERPDLDDIYMTACQAMTGQGGWPLTVMLTHDGKPFFAGTYFPKFGGYGRMGMMQLVPQLHKVWMERRQDIYQSAEKILDHLRNMNHASPGESLTKETLHLASTRLVSRYDEKHGGFGHRPKFPSPHNLTFLMRYWKRSGDKQVLNMACHTLLAMSKGGLFDHVGFGFHRYSTDAEWLLPHFEKMLYDQATIAMASLEAFQATGSEVFATIARRIFTYVLRDLTSPEGGFYSAEDADSEGVEGKFYVWKPQEIYEILGAEEGAFYCEVYQIKEGGNFKDEATGQDSGENIPHLIEEPATLARLADLEPDAFERRLEAARVKLFQAREKRIHPLKDDKILTDWNGLMIAALAMGSRILKNPAYGQAANAAVNFILSTLQSRDGRLMKRYRKRNAGLTAHLDDYAFMIWGLIELYQAQFKVKHLKAALALTETVTKRFLDTDTGAFFFSDPEGETLILRSRRMEDGAIPSGNSVMANNLLRLAHLTNNVDLATRGERVMSAFSNQIAEMPTVCCHLLGALNFRLGPHNEVVIAASSEDARPFLEKLSQTFLPNTVVMLRTGEDDEQLIQITPFLEDKKRVSNKPSVYVCRDFACRAPVHDPESMIQALQE